MVEVGITEKGHGVYGGEERSVAIRLQYPKHKDVYADRSEHFVDMRVRG